MSTRANYCTHCGRVVTNTRLAHRKCLDLANSGYKLVDNCHGMTGGDKWRDEAGSFVVVRPGPFD